MSVPPVPFIPATLAEHSVESLYALHGAQRPWIYWLSLFGVSAALGVLPLVPVEITVRSSGIVRPSTERVELKAAMGGRIARVLARDNDRVAANQPLVELLAADGEERLARNYALQREKSGLVADLRELAADRDALIHEDKSTADIPGTVATLHSPVLVREQARFRAQHEVHQLALARACLTRDRTAALAARGLVTEQERDDARYTADRAAADLRLLVQQTLASWQTQLRDEENALDQLVSEERRLQEERALFLVRAPVAGTLQGLTGLSAGAVASAGQSFGYVSPDAPLVVETYVASRDIGFVRPGQTVRLQIDAFPYTQWGLLDGRIREIAADATTNGAQAAFKVLVQPQAMALHLRNGATGTLRKGMTLTARFVVARRSLLQVLYEDASVWFSPQDRPASI